MWRLVAGKHAFDWALDDELTAVCGDTLDRAVQVESTARELSSPFRDLRRPNDLRGAVTGRGT